LLLYHKDELGSWERPSTFLKKEISNFLSQPLHSDF
jgi:hypothetical protein